MRKVFAICLVILGIGCASSSHGTKIEESRVSEIQKGVTTRAQIQQMFGQPMNVSLMGDGRRMMVYSYTQSDTHVKGTSFIPFAGAYMGGSEGTTEHQQLQIVLNKADVVEDYELSSGTNNLDHSNHGFSSSVSSTPAAPPAK